MALNNQQDAIPESAYAQIPAFPLKPGAQTQHAAPGEPSAPLPPGMASVRQHTADEVLELMNRVPLFMTTLDETDGEGGENLELEALKAMAYEGTRVEIAANFREQGNDCAKTKSWSDAKEYYDKALTALRGPRNPSGDPEIETNVVDLDEEEAREKQMEEACYVNRALCNLEKSPYSAFSLDSPSPLPSFIPVCS
ncbi:hypothetical protein EJ05DRAFT_480254 [Pseudovirgaria hyperparasitica]|uniref:TPR-like protein n=1 Tax=Pseudovirgaria hyperparasitica TaxID=470096 RepID=A0A6A6VUA1_9PEZI|nr:uncharacterized protein EJ05DRAFT_480254 [Pseudovirgaria hyperparasitica]KAF2753793.1 hypothetical protein EJ05DRAFT_480254 [Pseudovirgaria hyperparasitica]